MRVSVLMSIYAEPIEWIREALDSILNQSFQDFEVVLINDNPGREENDIIYNEYKELFSIIKYIKNETNIGLTRSLNKGLLYCEGQYIARMDADDISMNTRFEKQFYFMEENKDIVVCGSFVQTFGKEEKVWEFSKSNRHIRDFFFIVNPLSVPLAHPVAFIRSSAIFDNNLCYNTEHLKGQDFGLWYELLQVGNISNLDEVLLKYRLSDTQISSYAYKEQNATRVMVYLKHVNTLFRGDFKSLDLNLLNIIHENKDDIIKKYSVNHYHSILCFFYQHVKEIKGGMLLLIKEFGLLFNFNIILREKLRMFKNII